MEHLYTLYDALVSINVPSGTARQVVQAMERDMTGELATKSELQTVRTELHNSIERCRLELHADIELLRQETCAAIELLRQDTQSQFAKVNQDMAAGFVLIRSEMNTLSKEMTLKLGSLMVAMAGLIVTLQKLL